MSPSDPILEDCIERLNALPGIKAVLSQPPRQTCQTMAKPLRSRITPNQLTVTSPLDTVQYHYEIKSLSSNTVGLVISQLQRLAEMSPDRPLLLTRQVPDRLIDLMLEKDLEFVDAAGNLYLNSPAAYVLIRGKRLPKIAAAEPKTFTTNGFKLIYVILQDPDRLAANHRSIAHAAGIAASSVGSILKQLESMQYLQRKRNGDYQLLDYAKLLHRWELGYVERLRPKLFLGQFSPASGTSIADLTNHWSQQAEEEGFLIGGELGASIATKFLRPQSVTLHVQENYRPLLIKLRLKPDPQGSIKLLQQFGTTNSNQSIGTKILADVRLIYAELMMTGDDRLRETADRLLEKILAPDVTHA